MKGRRLSPAEAKVVRERALRCLREGKVEFSHPKAPEMFPLTHKQPKRFAYCEGALKVAAKTPSLTVAWGMKGFGFGEIVLYNKDGKLCIGAECMSKQFVKKVFARLVDDLMRDDDE